MANSITIKVQDTGKQYKLAFNRRTLVLMEEEGIIEKMSSSAKSKPLSTIYDFIHFAFLRYHPTITKEETTQIIDQIGDLEGFIKALVEILENDIKAVQNGGNEGNAIWGKN